MALTTAAVLAYTVLTALVAATIYLYRDLFLRGIPHLSASGLGLFRIALGAMLFRALALNLRLPDEVAPGGSASEAALWQPWPWVQYLATHWHVRDAIELATLIAIVAFAIGLFSRTAFLLIAVGFVVRLLVSQEYGVGSHAWVVLPLALAPLVLVPWGDGLSADNRIRRFRGESPRARPAGPHYGIALWLPGLVLGCVLAAAALAKLGKSGLEWVTGGAVRYHWVEDHLSAPFSWGTWIAGHEHLSVLFSAAGVGIEALFITHLFFRSQWVRFAYGAVALSLLGGFYVFQGVFWLAWWLLLLVFVPWDSIVGIARRWAPAVDAPTSPVRVVGSGGMRWYGMVAAVVALIIVEQVAISRAGVEQMPFFSNYPMYSSTWASPAAFNKDVAPIKFYRYDYSASDGRGHRVNLNRRVAATGIDSALLDAVLSQLRYPGQTLEPKTRDLLGAAQATYKDRFGMALTKIRVTAHARIFDFEDGELRAGPDPPLMTIDFDDLSIS